MLISSCENTESVAVDRPVIRRTVYNCELTTAVNVPVFHIISSLQLILLAYSLKNQRVATSLLKKHYLVFDMKLLWLHKANVDMAGKFWGPQKANTHGMHLSPY